MSSSPQQPAAGWYPDPAGTDAERYWDGSGWSQSTRDKPKPPPAPDAPYAPYGMPTTPGSNQGYGPQGYGHGYATYGQPGFGAGGRPLAGFGWRFLGYVIDIILVTIVSGLIQNITGISARMNHQTEHWAREFLIWLENDGRGEMPLPGDEFWQVAMLGSLVTFIVLLIYRIAMYGTMSATVGQLALGLRVVGADQPVDSKLTWGQAALRGGASAVLYSVIGFINGIIAAFTREKQTLADLIAKTHVVKIR